MKRDEKRKADCLLKTAHANRLFMDLPFSWHDTVMAEILRIGTPLQTASGFERLAPGFTLAATTLSIVLLVVAEFSLSGLSDKLVFAYTTQGFDLSLFQWVSL